jgi:crotonobetaine/carnitine-CoA ligase
MANALKGLGVEPGDTVTTILDNNSDAILVWIAINKLGAISVPVNTAYKGEFLRHQIADSGAKVLIAESDYADRILAVEDGLPEATTLLYRKAPPSGKAQRLKVMPLDDFRNGSAGPVDHTVRPGDLAVLIYTAGTTGPSKGCMISHNYMCNLARLGNEGTDRQAGEVNWSPLPLFHLNATASTVVGTLLAGGTAAFYPRFSLSNFWPEMERTGATIVSLLGSMIPLIADQAENEISKRLYGQIRAVRGAPFPAPLQEKWKTRFGIKIAGSMAYGLSEASVVTSQKAGEYAAPGSSGKRNDSFDVRIVDDEDNELPPGQEGEIIVRPTRPHVMFEGYWRRPEDTFKLMRNLWFHTGDIGKFDEEGFFYFVDRKKDYLRRRGENISSFEMETTFRRHPDIADVAVHAVFSEFTEDDVKVTAVLKDGAALSEEDLCKWSIDNLPYFAVPRYIEFRGDLPRNPVGRVLKYQLRDEGCTDKTWDREKSGLELKKR